MTTMNRRAMLRGIAATTAVSAAVAIPTIASASTDVDAVLAAWRAWRPLEEEGWRLAGELNEITSRHRGRLTIPGVMVLEKMCMSDENIDQVCDAAPAWMKPATAELRACAKRELADDKARAEDRDEKIGLTHRYNRQEEIYDLRAPLEKIIEGAGGSSPVVIAAKLDLAVSNWDHADSDLEDLGPSSLVSAIRGLLAELPDDMAKTLAAIAAGEGTIRQVYTEKAKATRAA